MLPRYTAASEGFTLIHRAGLTALVAIATVWTVSATAAGTTALVWLVLPVASVILFVPAIAGLLAARFWAQAARPVSERRTAFLLSTVSASGVYLLALLAGMLDAASAFAFIAAASICLVLTVTSAFALPAKTK